MPDNAILLWRPDTCGCVIHLAYDDTLPLEQRVCTPVTEDEAEAIVDGRRKMGDKDINPNRQPPAKLCPDHASLGYTKARYDQMLEENHRKRLAFAYAKEVMPDLKLEDYKWSFDKNRNLVAGIAGIDAVKKAEIQVKWDTAFGKGKAKHI